jgi:hypothetical protein
MNSSEVVRPKISEAYKPGDVDTKRFNYFHKAESDALLGTLFSIFKKNGNSWEMEAEKFKRVVGKIASGSKVGGLMSFIGSDSLDRIKELGVLKFEKDSVRISDDVIENAVKTSLKAVPALKGAIRNKLGR